MTQPPTSDAAIEARTQQIGADFLTRARNAKTSMLAVWSEGLMDWAMQDEAFKVQLFRFVDCFPTLKDNDAVYDQAYVGRDFPLDLGLIERIEFMNPNDFRTRLLSN